MRNNIRQLFRYFGSKTGMTQALIDRVPKDTKTLISLFAGSGVFEYNYAAASPHVRVICYDWNPCIVNFHHFARTGGKLLYTAVMLEHSRLAPMTKGKYAALMGGLGHTTRRHAAQWYIACFYAFSGKVGSYATKPCFEPPTFLTSFVAPKNIEFRLGNVFKVLPMVYRKHSGATLYMDPPYNIRERYYIGASNLEFGHARLSDLLATSPRGMRWMLSYNNDAIVKDMYRGRGLKFHYPKHATQRELLISRV